MVNATAGAVGVGRIGESSLVRRNNIFLALPFYQEWVAQTLVGLDYACDPRGLNNYEKHWQGGSFLARTFNSLWVWALNNRGAENITHFAMRHADVSTHTDYWLDVLVNEMRANSADLVSVVLPLKSEHGLTATAIRQRSTGNIRRLTMTEICRIPHQTFDAEMAGFPGWDLLPSTGLWICDFTKCWVEKVWFEVRDKILRESNGRFYVETGADDWLFAMKLHKLGLRVMSTKAVVCGHYGLHEYMNNSPWGTWKHDEHIDSFEWLTDHNTR